MWTTALLDFLLSNIDETYQQIREIKKTFQYAWHIVIEVVNLKKIIKMSSYTRTITYTMNIRHSTMFSMIVFIEMSWPRILKKK